MVDPACPVLLVPGASPPSQAPDMPETVIMQLSVRDVAQSRHPEPYSNDQDRFRVNPVGLDEVWGQGAGPPRHPSPSSSPPEQQHAPGVRAFRVLAEFTEKSKGERGEWPSSTSVHCYWCCHPFEGQPFGLPTKVIEELPPQGARSKFHVTGCFCSLACAAAYNFASKESMDERLNRHALLNALSASMGLGADPVRPAPDRVALSTFGGHLSLAQFRAHAGGGRSLLVYPPPMQTLSQQVEEVSESALRGSAHRFIPLDNARVERFQERVRLRRTKPLVNYESTLEHTMKLKIV